MPARRAFLLGAGAALAGPRAAAAAAPPLTLSGTITQGALVIGRTAPGAAVSLGGKPLRVDATGAFCFGLAHDAPPTARLVVSAAGEAIERSLAVAPRQYRVQRIDGLPRHFVEPPPELMKRLEQEYHLIRAARETDSRLPHWQGGFVWPCPGPVTGVYGSRRILNGKPMRPHFGVDVGAPTGTPVSASAGGTVTLAEEDLYFSGKSVIVDHGMGVSTLYIHLHELRCTKGQALKQGEVLGTVGSTGRSTGAHLHWGLNWFQEHLDPALLVPPRPGPPAPPPRKPPPAKPG
jgi:murein DD-endopeptidase MepM/ murein hydrolase activator NlpD